MSETKTESSDEVKPDIADVLGKLSGLAMTVCLVPVVFWVYYFWSRGISDNPERWSWFATYFGGLVSPILGMFAFIGLLITMDLQRKAIDQAAELQREASAWSTSTILTARRQLSWPVEAGNEFDCLLG